MGIFSFSTEYQIVGLIYFAIMFLFGFIAGFYISYLIFRKVIIKDKSIQISIPLIIGLFIGIKSFSYFFEIAGTIKNSGILYPLIFILELLIILAHYFFFLKPKKNS